VRDYESLAERLDGTASESRSAADWLAALRARRGEPAATRTGAARPRLELSPGTLLVRRYRILELLGRGGQGEVWRAADLKLRVEVALKALRAERFDPRALERIRREVTAARDVLSPNVCRIYDLIDAEGEELVSMEYVDGETVAAAIRRRAPFDLDEATRVATQLLAGLEAVHAAGIVHRDVKPENVMLTRAGRVVLMDLGLAHRLDETRHGSIAGTPPYMAPEQSRGGAVDARADLFSTAVLLAELVAPQGLPDRPSRESLWRAVREKPPRLAATPWAPVLARALEEDPGRRPASARELARALEDATRRTRDGRERSPYPGLACFTEAEAELFFGREAETEALWTRLEAPARLLAVVGPSGAGKSSFLRAGVVAARPDGWGALVTTPGAAPAVALGQALARELAGAPEIAERLVRSGEPEVALELLRHWRERHHAALLVVDQFEEVFTQCAPEARAAFVRLLGRAPLEAEVHVLLGLRDDFLLDCSEHAELAPLFSELTPLSAPGGAELRRALTQPALACGYHFEDDALVEEMVGEIEGERGALPLLAFAAARLWERRDRGRGELTRAAYETIGGVAGALARHAEEVLARIGPARTDLVRELFRNLVTAQGTCASCRVEDLVSVGADRAAARAVVDELLAARLLVTVEAPDAPAGGAERRVEIVHESLLSKWPRLVHWRTQDAEGALMREQVRRAAQVWAEKGRSEDLLWSGASYQEYAVWRARYPGRLTDVEQAFGEAMAELAGRQRRRRRRFAGGVAAALVATAITLALFWRASETARSEAELQARRAEASHLLALGRLELETHPSAALAYTLASLELADSAAARRFAVESLWEGPTEFALAGEPDPTALEFSPDGRWLAAGTKSGKVEIWERAGGPPRFLEGHAAMVHRTLFNARSDRLVSCAMDGSIRVWKLPGGEPLSSIDTGGQSQCWLLDGGERIAATTVLPSSPADPRDLHRVVRSWPLHGGPAKLHGEIPGSPPFHTHAVGPWIVANEGKRVRLHHLDRLGSPGRVVAEHDSRIMGLTLDPAATMVAVRDDQVGGEILIWSLTAARPTRIRSLAMPKPTGTFRFAPRGSMLSATGLVSRAFLWDLEGPPDAGPQVLRRGNSIQMYHAAFDPHGEWIATADMSGVAVWPLRSPRPYVLGELEAPRVMGLALAPDDSWIAAGGPFPIRIFPMRSAPLGLPRDLAVPGLRLAADPRGDSVLAAGNSSQGAPLMLSLKGAEPRRLGGFTSQVWAVAFSRDGRLAASGGGQVVSREGFVQVSDLEAGTARVLDAGDRRWVCDLEFLPDGRLLEASASGLRRWNLEAGTFETLRAAGGEYLLLAVDGAGRQAVSAEMHLERMTSGEPRWDDLESGAHHTLPAFGTAVTAIAFAPRGDALVTGNFGGAIQAGAVEGGEPHLLYGHRRYIWDIAVTSDGRSIVSAGDDGTVRVWPMPDVTQPPLHMLPREELLAKLRSLTNLRVVADPSSPTGYTTKAEPFAGWGEPPRWIALADERTPP